jgi:putative ABC transport system substrate-binding protein
MAYDAVRLGGRTERVSEVATELIRQKVDVIVTHATEPTLAIRKATSVIPIVFAVANDPLGTGLVSSLSRPGGNVTGFSLQQSDIGGKRLELLREVFPGLRQLAIMFNPGNPSHASELGEVEAAARTLGIDVVTMEIRRAEDIVSTFETLKGRAEALYVLGDPLFAANRVRINTLALSERMKTIHSGRIFVQSGGLMSYAADFPDLFRRAADYVDKILKGAKPADLPVQQPIKFELTINLKTAKALGLTVPPALLARADEVIE